MHESDNGIIEGFAVLAMFFFFPLHVEITFHSGRGTDRQNVMRQTTSAQWSGNYQRAYLRLKSCTLLFKCIKMINEYDQAA